MAAYADIIARGSGRAEYYAAIEGCKYVLSTCDTAPGAAWYADEGFATLPGLVASSIRRSCEGRPDEVWPDVGTFDLQFQDRDGTLSEYLVHLDACVQTWLTVSLSATDTTITVASTAGIFDTPGIVHVEREAIYYNGKNATQFTGCVRGYHGSLARVHAVGETLVPELRPIVSDGPGDLRGRRCVVYIAERTNTTLGEPEPIWVGYIKGSGDWKGKTLTLPVAHVLDGYLNGKLMGVVPQASLRGLYVPNAEGFRWGRLFVNDDTNGPQWTDIVPDGEIAFFESSADFVAAAFAGIAADLDDWTAGITGDGRLFLTCTEGSPFLSVDTLSMASTLLGFTESVAELIAVGEYRISATRTPAAVFAPLANTGAVSFPPRLYVQTGRAQLFVESMAIIESNPDDEGGDARQYAATISSINTTDDYLVIDPVMDFMADLWADAIVAFGTARPAVRQVIGLRSYDVDDVVRLLWASAVYAGVTIPFTLPERMRPEPCLRDGDVDWDELSAIVSAAPAACRSMFMAVDAPKSVKELVTGPLLACGVYAVVKEDGTVGWRRTMVPSTVDADSVVTDGWVDANRVDEIDCENARDRVVNVFRFVFDNAINPGPPVKLLVTDNASLQRHGARTADVLDAAEEIQLAVNQAIINDGAIIVGQVAQHMATAMRWYGWPNPSVRLPVTLKARALEIGDVALLTSAWVRNPMTGVYGVTALLALVMGWEREDGFATSAVDYLDLELVMRPAGGISPAALATDFTPPGTLTFANTDLFHRAEDATDLDHFEAGDAIEFVEYDDETPGTWTADVVSVDATGGEMVIENVAWAGAPELALPPSAPAIVRFQLWDDCTADQQGEGWVWGCDADDGLIQDTIDGWRWG